LVSPRHNVLPRVVNALLLHEYVEHRALLPEQPHVLPPRPPPFNPVFDVDALHDEEKRAPVKQSQAAGTSMQQPPCAPALFHLLPKHVPHHSKAKLPHARHQRLRAGPTLHAAPQSQTRGHLPHLNPAPRARGEHLSSRQALHQRGENKRCSSVWKTFSRCRSMARAVASRMESFGILAGVCACCCGSCTLTCCRSVSRTTSVSTGVWGGTKTCSWVV
jgi:hypothetical protein